MQSTGSWRPVGAILVENGSITQEQLDDALAEQARSGRKLGDILTSSGLISWLTLAQAIAEQATDLAPAAPAPAAPAPETPADAGTRPVHGDRQRVLHEVAEVIDGLGALISRLQEQLARTPGR